MGAVRRSLRRVVWGALVAFVALALTPVLPPAPAGADTVYLCTGYQGCAKAGYSHAGYAAKNDRMYWRMYAGHNCTNYAAYRMIQSGLSAERPWSGTGMAYNWGFANPDITDDVPAVGAVAWWNRNVPGAGSSGHVAYVEQVISATEIVISEDSWSGDFHWRRITKEGRGWPTGFVHFNDANVLVNTSLPVVSGTPEVGEQLSTTVGTWKPGGNTYAYQWFADGVAVAGATAATFVLAPEQRGKAITVAIAATRKDWRPGAATSAATAAVALGTVENLTPPAISGDPMVDETLTAAPGTWNPAPASSAFAWRADGELVDGARGPALTLTRDLVGKTITVVESVTATGYRKTRERSGGAGPVLQGQIAVTEPITTTGMTKRGETLRVVPGTTDPADVDYGYEWLRDGAVVAGAAGPTYALGPDDVGAAMGVRVTLSRRNYESLVRTFDFGGPVTSASTVIPKPYARKRAAAIRVYVRAVGVEPIDGPVQVTVGTVTQTVRLVDGFARAVFDTLKPGPRRVVVDYPGNGIAEPARAVSVVDVKR